MEKKKLWTALSVLALAMMPIAGNADDLHSEAVDRASVAPVSSVISVSALDVVVGGNEFSVASGIPWPAVLGTHFHSDDNQTPPAVSTNDVEVGDFGFNSEECRGMVEFDLTASTLPAEIVSAKAQCDVAILGGLYGQSFSVFDVEVSDYTGNNSEDIADFQIAANSLATFNTAGLSVGDTLAFDVTSQYEALLGVNPLGIRMQASTNPGVGAITFNNCVLAIVEENIDIDIKPGSYPNSINTKSMGVVPVAILGSEDFDVTNVDVSSLEFGPGDAMPAHDGHFEDVNFDGHLDLVSHYPQKDTGLTSSDTEACITGLTIGGMRIRGCDSVNIVN